MGIIASLLRGVRNIFVAGMIAGVVILLLILRACSGPATSATRLVSPTPGPSYPVRPPKTWKTLDVPPEGLVVWLEEAPTIRPELGGVKITLPSGWVVHDLPGADNRPGYEPAGLYAFSPEPAGSVRRVKILNRW